MTVSAHAPQRRRVVFLLVAALVVGGYFATMHFVRAHVDGRIARSEGRPLPAFDLVTLEGAHVTSVGLAGKRVVLNFFRSRCEACDAEADAVRQFAEEVRGRPDVALVSVLMDPVVGFSAEESAATLARHGYRHPVAMADRAFADAFHGAGWANVTPVTYVTDGNGVIRHALRGKQTLAALRATIE
ncbi:MAG: TlpA disulfide reductase family protein [Planctomycetota bacterium]